MGVTIIGGTGFIGRHLAKELSARGVPATAISSRPDYRFLSEHAPTVQGAELGTSEASSALESATVVIHLAHRSRPASNLEGEANEIAENVEPAARLFSQLASLEAGVRIIYASSGGQIYGASHGTPIPESAASEPQTSYALGKHMIEQLLHYQSSRGKIRPTILRIANPVGQWQLGGRHGLVSAAVTAARSGAPLSLFGDGANMRDYFDADEFASLLADLATDPNCPDGTFNIGSGIGLTERDVFDAVETELNVSLQIDQKPARGFDLPYAVLDIALARRELGWNPKVPLAQTIGKLDAALASAD
ncbi:MAG: NAD-dependent epimerase/dehydratase family protein [Pseudomonadota bacterium]